MGAKFQAHPWPAPCPHPVRADWFWMWDLCKQKLVSPEGCQREGLPQTPTGPSRWELGFRYFPACLRPEELLSLSLKLGSK